MNKIQLLMLVALTWTYEVIDATLCRGVNGTYCCSGYQWDEMQKNCIPCEPGYTGIKCAIKCLYPSYGKDCQSTCTCEKIDCDHLYGCRNNENVCNRQNGTITCCNGYRWNKEKTKCITCDKGFTGYNCEVTCPFPFYGLDCQAICNCTEGNCDPKDGCSGNSTRFVCDTGYIGTNCDTKCSYPSYGKNCQSTCTCQEMECNHAKGCINLTKKSVLNICNGQNGTMTCCNGYRWNEEKTDCIRCDKGFTGYNCEDICPFPSYGLDCQGVCNCTNTTCDPKDGCSGRSTRFACKPGYSGINCDTKCSYPFYGKDCQSECTCEEMECDLAKGCRNLTMKNVVNICNEQNGNLTCCNGYRWNEEKTKCIRCNKGFTGYNCEVNCPFPSYGLDCQAICNCTEAKCDPKYGCSGNSTRFESSNQQINLVTTNAVYSQNDSDDGKQSMFMAGIGVLAAVAFFIVLAIIYTSRMENNSKKEIDSNIYYTIK